MKKLVAISIMAALLLSVAVAAMASETNWILYVKASDTAGGAASIAGQYGTYNGAQDVKDAKDTGLSIVQENYNVGAFHYADAVSGGYADNPPVYLVDKRAPIGGLTSTGATQTFDIGIWAGSAYSGAADLMVSWYNLTALDILPAIKGVNYVYTMTITQDPTGQHLGWTYTIDPTKNGSATTPMDSLTWNQNGIGNIKVTSDTQIAAKAIVVQLKATPVGAPVTPEPSSMVALASGLFGLVGFGIRRRK